MSRVSVIIPAKNEEFLQQTIDSILAAASGDIEIIAVVDGYTPDPPIRVTDKRVKLIHLAKSIGQRGAMNLAAEKATGEYLIKTDGHSMLAPGFDEVLQADYEPDWTVIPRMYNLHAFDWVCGDCGRRQDNCARPRKCEACQAPAERHRQEIVWKIKRNKRTDFMWIDMELRARYMDGRTLREHPAAFKDNNYTRRPESHEKIAPVMTGQGACFFMSKKRYWELGGMDDAGHGSWGQMGVEVACKAWLSGGKLMVNKKTWFSHLFRTSPGYQFPYSIRQSEIDRAREYSRNLWLQNKWPQQRREFMSLVDQFSPLPGWHKLTDDLTVIYYSANVIDDGAAERVRRQLRIAAEQYPIVSVTQKPVNLGDNVVMPIGRSIQNVYRQVLAGAERAKTTFVALAEDDILYAPEHFQQRPSGLDRVWYNLSRWNLHLNEEIYSYRDTPVLSMCIAPRQLLIRTLRERLALPEIPKKLCGEVGLFEAKLGITPVPYETGTTMDPSIVICHEKGITGRKYVSDKTARAVEPWGEAAHVITQYWKGSKMINSPRQRTRMKGFPEWKVSDLWDNRFSILEKHKTKINTQFLEIFPPFVRQVLDGNAWDDQAAEGTLYFDYLVSRLHKSDRNPLTDKGRRRALIKFRDAERLVQDIRAHGIKSPLTFYDDDGRLVNIRGLRRLCILQELGYETVPVRVFKSRADVFRWDPEPDQWQNEIPQPAHTIHELAMNQFNKLGGKATDKYWVHNYTQYYDEVFHHLRRAKIKILELGLLRGASLALWHKAFPAAQIVGVDKNPDSWKELAGDLDRITFFQGLQEDREFLKMLQKQGPFDIIIDDCGHRPSHQWRTFNYLFETLSDRGYYVVEDCHHNYTPGHKAVCVPAEIAKFTDKLYTDYSVLSIRQWYNIAIIQKGLT